MSRLRKWANQGSLWTTQRADLADYRAEIQEHEFQADYDRKNIQKLNGVIESQRGEIYRALQGDECRFVSDLGWRLQHKLRAQQSSRLQMEWWIWSSIQCTSACLIFLRTNSDSAEQYKLNAQSLRLFSVHDDVNDAHRAGANRLQNKQMNNHWNKIGIFVKLMWKVSMRWKSWSDFNGLHSLIFLEEDWSKIETLSLNSQPEFRNYRMKLIVWMIREILMVLNQYALDNPTLPVNLLFSHIFQSLAESWAVLWECQAAWSTRDFLAGMHFTMGAEGNILIGSLWKSCETTRFTWLFRDLVQTATGYRKCTRSKFSSSQIRFGKSAMITSEIKFMEREFWLFLRTPQRIQFTFHISWCQHKRECVQNRWMDSARWRLSKIDD